MPRTLYDFPLSANAYRVRLFLGILGVEYQSRLVDLVRREHLHDAFLAVNPLGQVPVLDDGGTVIRDSHAIVLYLAEVYGPSWLAADAKVRARVAEWMFFDANELHNGIGFARNHFAFGVGADGEAPRARGIRALSVLDRALSDRAWLLGEAPTLADLACYPLTTVLEDARIDPGAFPAIAAWQKRIERIPGYTPMQA